MKPATIKDVAKEAGVSISVVSYVLNKNPNVSITRETRARVIDAARRLNYTANSIARGMRTKRSMAIGLATFWDISDSVFADVLKGIDSVIEERGYSVTYCNLRNGLNADKVVDLYKRRQIDGAILFFHIDPAGSFDETGFIGEIMKNGIPAVVINGNTEDPNMNYIYFDYHGTTYNAVNYLYKLGHRKFCYMLPDKGEADDTQAKLRINGYKDALKDLNLEDNGIYFDRESMDDIIRLLKPDVITGDKNKPETANSGGACALTAIVVNKTYYAVGLLKAFSENGINVPGSVSVIACNDEKYAGFLTPPLTTVRIPIYEIGKRSAEIMLEALEGNSSYARLKLPNDVVERESCKGCV